MSSGAPLEEQVVRAFYALAAEQMKNGAAPQEIQSMLVARGLEPESAATIVSNLARMRPESSHDVGKKNMRYGALWCIGGIIVTVVSHQEASGGGPYVIAWGAIIFGAIQFFRGLAQTSKE
jgi:hypothetical protein